jgi:hypothetical protein
MMAACHDMLIINMSTSRAMLTINRSGTDRRGTFDRRSGIEHRRPAFEQRLRQGRRCSRVAAKALICDQALRRIDDEHRIRTLLQLQLQSELPRERLEQ